MNEREMRAVIEGLLFAAGDEGLHPRELAEILEVDVQTVLDTVRRMQEEWKEAGRGLQIVEVAKVFQLTTLPEFAPYFERMARSPNRSQLSRAALETLAIIAYRQPITRAEIEEIRGVKCDKTIQSLQRKGLVKEVGRAEGVGRPILYGTTREFLEYFGLKHIEELPLPDTVLDWMEWEEKRRDLYLRLGVEPKERSESEKEIVPADSGK
ncbi:segregation and condensation protein B [Planifilum fimeticola]|uniref:Segregation and condensation protein B n=2 Tax=Planifilum fimeticola TaxID=201975 RepID=A0A2T0LD46_9BACL|nr:SMC-Scp complex subunit ScpB [Planifilum fimeticola]PRX39974.1 segregation and condensation protein B [Planifilum fimeticola]